MEIPEQLSVPAIMALLEVVAAPFALLPQRWRHDSNPAWNENDNLKFQLVAGRGIGRYINDSNSIGGQDAVFGPDNDLEALPIRSGVAAFQHWCPGLRSTLLSSFVNIDTFDYQRDSAYSKTQRASINLIWSPISRIDVGAELFWGQSTNKNDKTGTARQLQVQAKYRF